MAPRTAARRTNGYSRGSQEPTFGAGHMIHRRLEDDVWVACDGTTRSHEPDSRVHRYDRDVGFAISDEELAMCNRNRAVADAERASRNRSKQKSHAETVKWWALFERYCLEFHASEPYTAYLGTLYAAAEAHDEDEPAPPERLRFEAPPALILLAYTKYLRMANPAQAKRGWCACYHPPGCHGWVEGVWQPLSTDQ